MHSQISKFPLFRLIFNRPIPQFFLINKRAEDKPNIYFGSGKLGTNANISMHLHMNEIFNL